MVLLERTQQQQQLHEEELGEQRQWRRSCFFFFFFEGGIVGGTDEEAGGKSFCSCCCCLLLLVAFMGPAAAKKLMQASCTQLQKMPISERCIIIAAPHKFLQLFFSFSFWSVGFPSPCLHRIKAAGRFHGWLAGWCHGAGPHRQQQWGSCKPWTIWSRSAAGQCGIHHFV